MTSRSCFLVLRVLVPSHLVVCFFLLVFVFNVGAAVAQTPLSEYRTETLLLDEVIRTPFTPQQVFFLVAFSPAVSSAELVSSGDDAAPRFERYQAQLLPPFEAKESEVSKGVSKVAAKVDGAQGMLVWRAGVQVRVPRGAESVSYAVIIAAEGNRFASLSPRELSVSDARLFGGRTDALYEALSLQKSQVREQQLQVDALEAELRRLRADADIIADLARIVEVREDFKRTRQLIDDLQVDQENLQGFVKGAKALPDPRNFASRERQLTTQIAELVALAKETEGSEGLRRAESEQELRYKLEVIDRARGLNLQQLYSEIEQLRRGNQGAEAPLGSAPLKKPGASAETPDDYLR